MENTLTLDSIAYRSVYDHTAFFVGQLKGKSKEEFEMLLRRVKSRVPAVLEMMYTFDESIWLPDQPELHGDLVKFHVRLTNSMSTFSFYMLVSKGADQELVSAPLPTTKWYGG